MEIESLGPDRLPGLALIGSEAALRLAERFPVEVVSSLLWRTSPEWRIETRTLDDTLIFIPVRGEVELTVGRRRVLLARGQAGLIPEGVAHAASYAGACRYLEVFAVHVRAQDAWGTQACALFADPAPRLPEPQRWFRRLRQLTALLGRQGACGRAVGRILVADLLCDLALAGAQVDVPALSIDPRIAAAVLAMRDLRDPRAPTVAQLSRAAGLSEVRFRTLFRRATGRSPKEYQGRLAVDQAAVRLRQTDLPVKAIAADCGFSSDHYFHQRFRAAMGMTPSAYRRLGSALGL